MFSDTLRNMEIEKDIKTAIEKALKNLSIDVVEVELEHPADFSHGDYSTNVALRLFEGIEKGISPKSLQQRTLKSFAEEIV